MIKYIPPTAEVRRLIQQTKKKKTDISSLEITYLKIPKFTIELKKMFQQCYKLEILVLSDCELQSLQNLPNLPDLYHIDLTSNNITDQQIKYLKKYKRLKIVNLGSNNIKQLIVFYQLQQLHQLQQLQLYQNPVAQLYQYRNKGFQIILSLKILDGENKHGRFIEEEQDYDQDIVSEVENYQESDDQWEKQHDPQDDQEQFEHQGQEYQDGQDQNEQNTKEKARPKMLKQPKTPKKRMGRKPKILK